MTKICKNYSEALTLLNGRKSRKVAGNTVLSLNDKGDIDLTFHQTKIITYFKDGGHDLFSGGYRTVTTKRRMNQFTRCQIVQRRGAWYVNGQPFVEGMVLNHGSIYNVSEV